MPSGAPRITLASDGDVNVKIADHEMGMGASTTQTIITAFGAAVDNAVHNSTGKRARPARHPR